MKSPKRPIVRLRPQQKNHELRLKIRPTFRRELRLKIRTTFRKELRLKIRKTSRNRPRQRGRHRLIKGLAAPARKMGSWNKLQPRGPLNEGRAMKMRSKLDSTTCHRCPGKAAILFTHRCHRCRSRLHHCFPGSDRKSAERRLTAVRRPKLSPTLPRNRCLSTRRLGVRRLSCPFTRTVVIKQRGDKLVVVSGGARRAKSKIEITGPLQTNLAVIGHQQHRLRFPLKDEKATSHLHPRRRSEIEQRALGGRRRLLSKK